MLMLKGFLPGTLYKFSFARCPSNKAKAFAVGCTFDEAIMPKRKTVQRDITSYVKTKDKKKQKEEVDQSEREENKEEIEAQNTSKRPKLSNDRGKNGKGDLTTKNVKTGGKPMNRTDTDYSSMDLACEKKNPDGKAWNFKISSWNIVSLKSITSKNGMEFLKQESPDIMCFQETKCSEKKVPEEAKVEGYHRYFVSGTKEGYAGVALYSKEKPIKVDYGIGDEEHDSEGRVITAEYEKFYLVTAYVPNAGQKLVTLPKRLKWDPAFRAYLKNLDTKKPVILCGDLNVAHNEIDLKNPATNTKSAGFTKEEREGMTTLLEEGFVDTFRHLYPGKEGAYTYWNYIGNARSRNAGWRLDYFILSKRLVPAMCDNVIRDQVFGSDHCPVTLFLNI